MDKDHGCRLRKPWLTHKTLYHTRKQAEQKLQGWQKVPSGCLTASKSNQSNLKEICPEYSLEGLMLKLKLQYSGHLMQRTDSLEKTLMLGKTEGRRRRARQRMRWLDGITDSMDVSFEQAPGVGDGQGGLACCSPWGPKESDRTEWLNWTELNINRLVAMNPKANSSPQQEK